MMKLPDPPEWAAEAADANRRTPEIGDLWSLSWDGAYEGAVVIAAVKSDHILGIPLTEASASPTEVTFNFRGNEFALWPQAETGLGLFLLDQWLGNALAPDEVKELRRWGAGLDELITLAAGSAERDVASLWHLLENYRRLCFIEWPSSLEPSLDLDAVGLTPREFADAFAMPAARVLQLWQGAVLDEEEASLLDEDWLVVRHDDATTALSSPSVKRLVQMYASAAGIDERTARNNARIEFALAARTNPGEHRNATRASDTLLLLIEAAHASGD